MVASASLSHERSAATAPGTSPRLGDTPGVPARTEPRRMGGSGAGRATPGGAECPGRAEPPVRGWPVSPRAGLAEPPVPAPRPSVRAVTRCWERSLFLAGALRASSFLAQNRSLRGAAGEGALGWRPNPFMGLGRCPARL